MSNNSFALLTKCILEDTVGALPHSIDGTCWDLRSVFQSKNLSDETSEARKKGPYDKQYLHKYNCIMMVYIIYIYIWYPPFPGTYLEQRSKIHRFWTFECPRCFHFFPLIPAAPRWFHQEVLWSSHQSEHTNIISAEQVKNSD